MVDQPNSHAETLENEHVHKVYDQTAHYFKEARYKAWPKVRQFMNNLEPGSLVADVGCGHGKYLHINKNIFKIGCDRSEPLVQIASNHGHSVVVSDNLCLPFRDGCFDVVISIGVVHHFTTVQRRVQALRELSRILCPGGRMMVYAWAFEQKHRKFKAQDVLVPWSHKPKKHKVCKKAESHDGTSNSEDSGYDSLRSLGGTQPDGTEGRTNAAEEEKRHEYKDKRTERQKRMLHKSKSDADKKGSIPDIIWQKIQTLIQSPKKTIRKPLNYQEMVEFLLREEQDVLKPSNERSSSVSSDIEGFAVRAFPGSSQPSRTKHLSISTSDDKEHEEALKDSIAASSDSDQDWRRTTEQAIARVQSNLLNQNIPEYYINSRQRRRSQRSRTYSETSISSVGSDTGSDSSDVEDMTMTFKKVMSPKKSNENHDVFEEEHEQNGQHKRYYHVFREGELPGLVERYISEMNVIESFYDHANWCVIAQKT